MSDPAQDGALQNLIIGISGQKGYGKSTYLRQLVADEKSLLVIDTLAEHEDWLGEVPGNSMKEQIENIAEPPEAFQWSIMLNPGKDAARQHLDWICKAAYRAGAMTVVIEEADYFSSPHRESEGLYLLVNYGRHRAVNLIWVTRNLARVSRDLTSQTDVFVLFRTSEPLYVDGLADRLTPEQADEIERLERYHYLITEPHGNGEVIHGVTQP